MLKMIVSGRVISDLELCKTESGKEYSRIRVSSKTKEKDQDGKYKYDYVDIVSFGELAKHHYEYLKKGSSIMAICTFRTTEYKDKDTGKKRYGYSLYAESIDYLHIPKGDEEYKDIPAAIMEEMEIADEGLPF